MDGEVGLCPLTDYPASPLCKLNLPAPYIPPVHCTQCKAYSYPECDISVSKLLDFETFPIFWMVSDSVSKKFGIEKSIGFGIGKNLVSKKVSDSVSEKFGIEKVSDSISEKIWYRKKYLIRYRKNLVSKKVTDSISKKKLV